MEENHPDLPESGVLGEFCRINGELYYFGDTGWQLVINMKSSPKPPEFNIFKDCPKIFIRESPALYTPEEIEIESFLRTCPNDDCNLLYEINDQRIDRTPCIFCKSGAPAKSMYDEPT